MLTPYAQLSNLLRALFDTHELRSFLRGLDRGKDLVDALPEGQGLALLSGEAVDVLRRRGRIDGALFEALAVHAPGSLADITAVARSWGVMTPPWSRYDHGVALPQGARPRSTPPSAPAAARSTPVNQPLLVFREGEESGAYIRDKTRLELEDADFKVLRRLAERRDKLVPYSELSGNNYAQRAVSAIRKALRSAPAHAREDANRIDDAVRTVRTRGYRLALAEGEILLNPESVGASQRQET